MRRMKLLFCLCFSFGRKEAVDVANVSSPLGLIDLEIWTLSKSICEPGFQGWSEHSKTIGCVLKPPILRIFSCKDFHLVSVAKTFLQLVRSCTSKRFKMRNFVSSYKRYNSNFLCLFLLEVTQPANAFIPSSINLVWSLLLGRHQSFSFLAPATLSCHFVGFSFYLFNDLYPAST